MRIGLCTGIENASVALGAGFDYVEVSTSALASQVDFAPQNYREARAEASNLFFPSDIRLNGSSATPYREYMERAIARAAEAGISVMVIGSAGARSAPEGVPIDAAFRRFIEVAAEAQAIASGYGIHIAPESLNRSETNVANDLPFLAADLHTVGVGYTADAYHVLYEWSADGGSGVPDAEFWERQLPFAPTHVHIANLERQAPEGDDPMLLGFIARLQDLGYQGRVSLEARLQTSLEEAATNLRQLIQ